MQPPSILVLFDIDGTLIKPWGRGLTALKRASLEIFGTFGKMDGVTFSGMTDWQILIAALADAGITADDITPKIPAFNTCLARHIADMLAEGPLEPCPGAPDVVNALAANPDVVIGLVTGNMSEIVREKLVSAHYDPADFSVGAFGSEGWERSMLPPLALKRAEELTGAHFAPEGVIVVGDTPMDIACAGSIGARTLAVGTGPSYTTEELRSYSPTYAFDSMADSHAILAAILHDGHQSA
ncbi:MAG TPA: HAD hydrolase-like protein [Aggregatilinea sp.]|jgi:phosphoglycolate phosphatase-like HAD superfamily hydrolase|uniref:HAD family hydrolase n=1 Tax=Aggregatilinea sp. TaxID=2806333 RepID=UPI002CD57F1B|nr:HAD hydrolase-like protein [Aggregatilinea sp.]HML22726.1 HAD hydrolase-like protein [Aggregatilinea sp.]